MRLAEEYDGEFNLADFTEEEIAEMLNISRNAVKMRLYRARAILKEKLMEEDANV